MTSTPDELAYCTREMVQATLDQSDARRLVKRIDDACRSASRELEGILHRRFYPTYGTRYPQYRWVSGDTLWLNHIDHEILTLDSLTVDGDALVAGTDYYLDPDRPPYTAVRLLRESTAAWPADQRDIVNVGEFGGSKVTEAAGALAAAIAAASTTTMTVTNSAVVGVGDMVLIDSEQVIVTGKASATTTATVAGTVDADESDTTITVSSGALVNVGEMILIDGERMHVEDITGNTLIVTRAEAGSVLAAHSVAAVVYAPRLCTIRRGCAGTTAAGHAIASELARNVAPSLVVEAAAALAINSLEQGKSGYARIAGAGDNARASGGTGVAAAVAAAVEAADAVYGRRGRIGGF